MAQHFTRDQQDDAQRHIRVLFPGQPAQDYRAARVAAEQYAATALLRGAIVIIDGKIDDDFPPLPMDRLSA